MLIHSLPENRLNKHAELLISDVLILLYNDMIQEFVQFNILQYVFNHIINS